MCCLVHAPSSEKELMDKGFGSQRDLIMHNDFIIVGPKDDPAGIRGKAGAADAFAQIAEAKPTLFPVPMIPVQIKKNCRFGKLQVLRRKVIGIWSPVRVWEIHCGLLRKN